MIAVFRKKNWYATYICVCFFRFRTYNLGCVTFILLHGVYGGLFVPVASKCECGANVLGMNYLRAIHSTLYICAVGEKIVDPIGNFAVGMWYPIGKGSVVASMDSL